MQATIETGSERALEARAAGLVYETLAEALLNVPDGRILSDVARAADLLGAEGLRCFEASADLEQRYFDRFFVPASPYFVPLSESCLLDSAVVNGSRRYGPTAGPAIDHVERCYRSWSFEFSSLTGYPLAVKTLRADSLASELAFAALLARAESEARSEDEARRCHAWRKRFVDLHLARWVDLAAEAMAEADDDFFARLCALVAAWVALDRENLADSADSDAA